MFLAYAGLGSAWALAVPVNGHTDERAHIIRAYAVATGQILGPQTKSWVGFDGSEFKAPANLLPANDECLYWPTRQPASCLAARGSDASLVTTTTWVGRYSPVYYAVAGQPIKYLPNDRGILLARLITAGMVAALIATAIAIAVRAEWGPVAFAVALAASPTVVALSGAVNPNAVEAAASILLWISMLALTRQVGESGGYTRLLVGVCAVAGGLLLSVRTLGPAWLAVILMVCVFLAAPDRLRVLRRRADVRWVLGLWTLGLVAMLGWDVLSGALAHTRADWPFEGSWGLAAQTIIDKRLTDWAVQLVAIFGYTETVPPMGLIIGWWVLIAGVVAVGYACAGSRRVRGAIVTLAIATPVVLIVLELRYLRLLGFVQNGRYVLPIWSGMIILAAFGASGARWGGGELLGGGVRSMMRAGAVTIGMLNIWALGEVMTRFQKGPDLFLDPFHGSWAPPTGAVLPVIVAAVSAIVLVAVLWATAAFDRAPVAVLPERSS